jgi:secondary thiamine-phosphate synthase enzyme
MIMVQQITFSLKAHPQGFHLVTKQILQQLNNLPQTGLLNLFIKHTSAALTINENADPTVQTDLHTFFNDWIPDHYPKFKHTLEGADDMTAHIKASVIGQSVTIPITNHKLNLGIWQGIYLCEFRHHAGQRNIVATIV